MDGLERLEAEILREAKDRAAAILRNADEYIARSEKDCEAKIKRQETEVANELARDLEALRRRYRSLSDNERRKSALAQRRELLEAVPAQALAELNAASAEEKAERYAKWIKAAGYKAGKISLSAQENAVLPLLLERLGPDFEAGEAAPISGGLILSHGETIDNLSYDLYLRRNSAEISTFLAERLFAEEK